MKNQSLKNVVKEYGKNPNLIITKSEISGSAINIHIEKPSYQDVGTYPYYTREKDRDADYEKLLTLLKHD